MDSLNSNNHTKYDLLKRDQQIDMLSNIKDNRYQRESTLPEQEPFLSLWKDGDDRVERNILMKGGNGDVDIQCKKKKYHRQKTIRGYR